MTFIWFPLILFSFVICFRLPSVTGLQSSIAPGVLLQPGKTYVFEGHQIHEQALASPIVSLTKALFPRAKKKSIADLEWDGYAESQRVLRELDVIESAYRRRTEAEDETQIAQALKAYGAP